MIALRRPLTLEEVLRVRIWRNDPSVLPATRDGYLTEAAQTDFYRDVIQHPESPHAYYAVEYEGQFIGMGGITHQQGTQGEISLILAPEWRGRGLGSAVVKGLITEAFDRLGLSSLVGECTADGPTGFWLKQMQDRPTRIAWTWGRA